MNGVHDLGGMHGFGPIEREANEPLFHAEWEARVRAMDRLVLEQGYFTLDAHRYGIERMAPADYLRASYYERWLASLESLLIEQGIIDRRRAGRQDRSPCAGTPMPRRVRVAIQYPPPAPSERPTPPRPRRASRWATRW